ncbi:MAG: class D beta-lactamase [Cyanobacteria bacterium J06636_16]
MKCVSPWLGYLVTGSLLTILPQSALAEPVFEPAIAQVEQPVDITAVDFAQHFQDLGIEGSILIYALQGDGQGPASEGDRTYQHNPERNTTPFLPASTFKILNSLIALETGVIANDLAILTWDGVERSIPAWNRDLNLRIAFNISAVWFYQVLARRVGHERMQQWVAEVGYGNQTIGSTEDIDSFWLSGDIRITPEEQVQFLQRLYNNNLPFSERAIATVKDIMIVEQTPDYTIRAKTGWALQGNIGWYVGYVEQGENVYFFATNIDIPDEEYLGARLEVTRRSLETLGLL